MSSERRRHRRISPMPLESSFPPVPAARGTGECTTYILSEEQLAEVIAKYGPPKGPLQRRTPMSEQRPKKGEPK